jgi:hypothetical protein
MSKVLRRTLPSALAAILAGTTLAVIQASPAHAATWSVASTPTSGTGGFSGVDAVNSTNVWAVGGSLTARFNGTAWVAVSNPMTSSGLLGVDGSAPDNVWAVGRTGSSGPLAARWNGTSWSVASSPALPPDAVTAELAGVKTFSTTDAWAAGKYNRSSAPFSRTLIHRWNGTSWTAVPTPNPDSEINFLTDVDGAASNDVWAIGNVGFEVYGGTPRNGLVLHWDGSSWSQVSVPGTVADSSYNVPTLEDIFVRSASDIWIVGRAFSWSLFKFVSIALHWDGVSWQRSVLTTGPNDAVGFKGVAALSATQVYATGSVIAKWTGAGWSIDVSNLSGGQLGDVAATGSSTFWAVGGKYDSMAGTYNTLAYGTTNG